MLSAFLDLSLALNTLVAGSGEPLQQQLVPWKRAAWAIPVADANKLVLWGKLWEGCVGWARGNGDPFLALFLQDPALQSCLFLFLLNSWLKVGTCIPYLSRLARLIFQFGEENIYYLRSAAMLVQTFQISTVLKWGTVPFIPRWKSGSLRAKSTV